MPGHDLRSGLSPKRRDNGRDPATLSDIYVSRGWRGRGVFAGRAFERGEIVERCPTISVLEGEVSGKLMNYVFQPEDGYVLVVLGYGMLYNHAARPNLEWVQTSRTSVTFTSKRAIKQGEELTHDYSRQWWAARSRRPR